MLNFTNIAFSLVIGLAVTVLIFGLQLLFCFKARKVSVKLILTYIVFIAAVFCTGLILGIYSVGPLVINTMKPFALGTAIVAGVSVIGIIGAWLTYAVMKITSKNKGE